MNSSRQLALYVGTNRIGHAHVPATLPPTAYFCETCGQVWGRAVPLVGSEAEPWRIYSRHCPRHSVAALWWETAGSFTQTSWIEIADLDRDALIYEFEREIERKRNEHDAI